MGGFHMKPLTLSDSMGANNSYEVICSESGQTQKYFLCLMQISLGKEKNYEGTWKPCRKALQTGSCPAMSMREEEKSKGEPIYYEADDREERRKVKDKMERQRLENLERNNLKVDRDSFSYLRGRYGAEAASAMVEPKTPGEITETQPEPDKSMAIPSLESELVSHIASSMAKNSEKPKPIQGEKPMEFAKRLREWKKSNAA